MKVQEQALVVERSGQFVEANFRIKPSRKAFKILSDGLYSNKIRACLRELGTNAADAHVMANNVVTPFLVHLPNNLEPYFSLRDFGTGLSQKDIETIYTTYFESTKTESDDVTGCLGLGSKSPFSYTDNFTIVDYYDGKRHTYSAFIGESGFPTIALMATEETDQRNGLEITFPVKNEDFSRFQNEAKFVYSFFKTRPTIVGQQVEFEDVKSVFSGNDWRVLAGQGKNHVVMGNVAYPLDMSQVGARDSVFNGYSVHIEVAIGEVEMTASRESLEYTTKTKSAISKRIKEILDCFKVEMQKELDKCETYWEACLFFRENSLMLQGATWKGRKVGSNVGLGQYFKCDRYSKNYYGGGIKQDRNRQINYLDPSSKFILVENDLKRGAIERTKEYLRNHSNREMYAYLFTWEDAAQKQAFLDAVGEMPKGMYMLASELPKKPSAKKTNNGPSPQSFTFSPGHELVTNSWEEWEFDANDGGVYIELERWQPTDYNVATLNEIFENLRTLGHNLELVGLRKSLVNKIKDNADWVDFKSYLIECVKTHEKDFEYALSYDDYCSYSNLLTLRKCFSTIDLKAFLDSVEYCKSNRVKLYKLRALLQSVGMLETVKKHDVETQIDKLKKKYPMIFFVISNCYVSNYNVKVFGDYINLVDKNHKNVVDDEVAI